MDKPYNDDPLAIIDATFDGDYDLVKRLLEENAPVNIQNELGETALMVAVDEGWFTIAELLIKNSANVNIADKLGDSPLAVAIWKESRDMIHLLEKNDAKPVKGDCARKQQWDEINEDFAHANAIKNWKYKLKI